MMSLSKNSEPVRRRTAKFGGHQEGHQEEEEDYEEVQVREEQFVDPQRFSLNMPRVVGDNMLTASTAQSGFKGSPSKLLGTQRVG